MHRTLIAGLLLLALALPARAADVVVPNLFTHADGDSANEFPFNPGSTPGESYAMRYQQRYEATQFPAGPLLITHIAFRLDALTQGSAQATISHLTIGLSTIPSSVVSLNPRYSANTGADYQLLFDGPLSVSTENAFDGTTKSFDLLIPLAHPFPYDPSHGNLLLDLWNASGEYLPDALHGFDAEATQAGTAVSRVFSIYTTDDEYRPVPADQMVGFADSMGLVTQFTYIPPQSTPIPEPVLGAWAILPLALLRRKPHRN